MSDPVRARPRTSRPWTLNCCCPRVPERRGGQVAAGRMSAPVRTGRRGCGKRFGDHPFADDPDRWRRRHWLLVRRPARARLQARISTAERVFAALVPRTGRVRGRHPALDASSSDRAGGASWAITIRRPPHERQTVVAISGAVTATAVPAVRRALTKALRTGAPILVDLTRVAAIHRARVRRARRRHDGPREPAPRCSSTRQPARIRTLLAAFGIPSEEPLADPGGRRRRRLVWFGSGRLDRLDEVAAGVVEDRRHDRAHLAGGWVNTTPRRAAARTPRPRRRPRTT